MPRTGWISRPEAGGSGVPTWVHHIGTAVWISGPDRRVRFINARAEALLGLPALEGLGTLCDCLIAGKGPSRSAFCGKDCPARQLAQGGHPVPPFDLTVERPDGIVRRIHLLVIPARCPPDTELSLIHCAFDRDTTFQMERYFSSLASRVRRRPRSARKGRSATLTEREKEVLSLLARGESLRGIALRFELSYHTVRNHVQHILEKLGAHSMKEAIAAHVLGRDQRG